MVPGLTLYYSNNLANLRGLARGHFKAVHCRRFRHEQYWSHVVSERRYRRQRDHRHNQHVRLVHRADVGSIWRIGDCHGDKRRKFSIVSEGNRHYQCSCALANTHSLANTDANSDTHAVNWRILCCANGK